MKIKLLLKILTLQKHHVIKNKDKYITIQLKFIFLSTLAPPNNSLLYLQKTQKFVEITNHNTYITIANNIISNIPYTPIIPAIITTNHSRGINTPILHKRCLTPNKAKIIKITLKKNLKILSNISCSPNKIYEDN